MTGIVEAKPWPRRDPVIQHSFEASLCEVIRNVPLSQLSQAHALSCRFQHEDWGVKNEPRRNLNTQCLVSVNELPRRGNAARKAAANALVFREIIRRIRLGVPRAC
jgi:hypothetical protein